MTFAPPSLPLKEYYCQMDGLTFTFRAYQLPDGSFEGKFTVYEGSADFNAIYFGDGIDDGTSPSLGGSLNMNGGSDTDWDQAVELSKPGLGKMGAAKPTYLSANEVYTFALDIDSLDEIQEIGVRATSTSTAEGSIKCELTPINEPHDDDHDHDEDHDEDEHGKEDEEEETSRVAQTEPEPPAEGTDDDLDDAEFYRQFAAMIGEVADDAPVEDDEAEDAEAFLL